MAFELTRSGEQKAEEVHEASSPAAAVLVYMYKVSKPVEIEEVVDELRTDDEKAVKILGRLMGQGYIEEV